MEGPQSDWLPGACRQRRALTARLLACLDAWGYAPVAPPALERYDLLARGLSDEDRQRCVRFVAPPDGRLLALRADVTPQLARMVAQRVGGSLPADAVVRMSYAAQVVRHPSGPADRAEVNQVGVELLGDGHVAADAELVSMCHAVLQTAGLRAHRIDLAHTGVATAAIDALNLSDELRAQVRTMLAHKDRQGLAARLAAHEGATRVAAQVASLCDRFGPPTIVAEAMDALPMAAVALARLSAVAQSVAPDGVPLTVDLGEVRGDDYYTGLRLRAWAPGVSRPVVRGGRYDDLLARYGAPMPAIGFAVDLEALEAALNYEHGGAPSAPRTGGRLVGVLPGPDLDDARLRAAAVARRARAAGTSAWVTPVADTARAMALADLGGADSITLIGASSSQAFDKHSGQWVQSPPQDEEGS